ncbi:cytochrome c maturation protein CcmE [Cytophagaceae bacterium DM2B3-1]|uniref:Cytochrome c maturation protein CcmE n=2 Tax=Xanthocytophaga TaxID=3078918 RepID=A0ABT7CLG6_9BACT|nr:MULTISPECIES: cytochrome c maturation protein CcmE [Xanthocytophaga]MDJ1469864.1 cytochrome c maturation protein CcmE [Xanthocytophaga flavus]MDJ1494376.1 cytochrome c maturation protein CcmE [Xanthocytophaga flavus]MDJ1503211.1 cytochrome c maturation protein CcmE [Xanthocytophaga agilis]
MKITHIIGIIVIVVAIAVIVSTTKDVSTYVTFKEAADMAASGKSTKVHVVGSLKKDATGNILEMSYQPEIDPNHFTFKLIDRDNKETIVVYDNPKPQDFERSEQVVVIGHMQNNEFIAEKILMKCPSKYQETEIKGTEKAGSQASL